MSAHIQRHCHLGDEVGVYSAHVADGWGFVTYGQPGEDYCQVFTSPAEVLDQLAADTQRLQAFAAAWQAILDEAAGWGQSAGQVFADGFDDGSHNEGLDDEAAS